jgi:hypothetical protein
MSTVILQSTLTCPHCGARQLMTMPTDACLYFHECVACRSLLQPRESDCCVFCSYGDVPCPPRQVAACGGAGCRP